MRKSSTEAEKVFWNVVKGRKFHGLKFNRQHIIRYRVDQDKLAYYIVDLYNHERKVVIEIDGDVHLNQIDTDEIRSQTLRSLGLKVIRFTNYEVLNHFDSVRKDLELFCKV